MCYIIITSGSLIWFLLSLAANMLVMSAIVTPKWLIGPQIEYANSDGQTLKSSENLTDFLPPPRTPKYPSVGIYTRCKSMQNRGFDCGRFDLDGFATNNEVYPTEWKACMFFISLGFVLLFVTVFLTLISCCKQSAFGKSIHNMTACAQVVAGICIMLALFLHPLGWGELRVQQLCGFDAEPFYPASCTLGISFYCAVSATVCTFISAGVSLKAESSNMRTRIKRRVEEGDRLVCIP